MAEGSIKGKDVLDGVKEEIAATNAELKKLLATYNELYTTAQSYNSTAKGNSVQVTSNKQTEQEIKLLQQKAVLTAKLAQAEKAEIQTKSAVITLEEKKNRIKRSNAQLSDQEKYDQQQLNRLKREDLTISSRVVGAYQKLSTELLRAKRTLKDLTVSQGANANATKKAQIEVDTLTKRIKDADHAAGDFQRNVGNYPSRLSGAIGAIKQLVGVFGAIEGIRLFAGITKDAVLLARQAKGVEYAFEQLGATGVKALEAARKSTRGLISDLDIKKSANEFKNFNLDVAQLPVLLEFVSVTAAQTGKSFDILRDSLVEGISKESKLRLDNLGISAERLNEELQKTPNYTEAVANIAREKIAQAGAIIDETADATQRWNVATENLSLNYGKLLTSIKGTNFAITSVEAFTDVLKLTGEYMNDNATYMEALTASYRVFTKAGRDTNASLIEEIENRKANAKAITEEYNAFILRNGSIGPLKTSQKDFGIDLFKEEDKRLLQDINAEIDKYNQELSEGLFSTREEAKAIQDKIAALEKEREAILGKKDATNSYKKAVDDLTKSLEKLKTVEIGTTQEQLKKTKEILDSFADTLGIGIGVESIEIDDFSEGLDEMAAKVTETYRAMANEADFSAKRQNEALASVLSFAQEIYGIDLQTFIDVQRKKEEEGLTTQEAIIGYSQATKETLISISQALLSETLANLQVEEEKNRETLDAILNDKNASDKKKEQAQIEYDKKEAELKKKKAKADKQNAIVNTIIATSVAILQAYAQLGPIAGTIAAVLIGSLGALNIAKIKSQPIPEFFRGKKATDNFEGLGTWGERRREVLIDSGGNIEVSPNRKTPRMINKSDIIVPSIPQFNKEVKTPTSEVFKRLNGKLSNDTKQRTAMFQVSNSIDTTGMEAVFERVMQKYSNRPVNARVNVNLQRPKTTGYHG